MADKCWRHDYDHREYVCRCVPPRLDDAGFEDTLNPPAADLWRDHTEFSAALAPVCDDEVFCRRCLAGAHSSEHAEKCYRNDLAEMGESA